MMSSIALPTRSVRRRGEGQWAAIVRRLAIVAVLLSSIVALSIAPAAAATLTVVTPTALNGWETFTDSTGAVTFESGPGTPPSGTASVKLSVGSDGNSAARMRYLKANGTRLDEITTLSYSTYVVNDSTGTPGGPPDQAPYLVLNLDNDGDDVADEQLFFEPVYQDGTFQLQPGSGPITPQGPLAMNTWQTWDALNGGWWENTSGLGGPPLRTIAGYLALHPDARLISTTGARAGLGIETGRGAGAWVNFVGNADNLTLVAPPIDRTFDFELPVPCVSPFDDVPDDHEACAAIVALNQAGVIQGYDTDPPTFGLDDDVQRAQMTSFLVRGLKWEGKPTTPRTFTDLDELLGDLATTPLIAANACTDPADDSTCVAQGYEDADCVAMGKEAPCFGPTDQVSYAQVISFITRAFGLEPLFAWQTQACGTPPPYSGLPADHASDICTFNSYAGTIPDAPSTQAAWDAPAPREWVARVLYQALLTAP